MSDPIRTLLPPGGFSNQVGHYLAALDVGSEYTAEAAKRAEGHGRAEHTAAVLLEIGGLESLWVHQAVGGVPTPPAPGEDADVDALLGWLDAVRTVTIMVLRPLQDRDLERIVTVEGASGPRTLKRLLSELLYLQGALAGRMGTTAPRP